MPKNREKQKINRLKGRLDSKEKEGNSNSYGMSDRTAQAAINNLAREEKR